MASGYAKYADFLGEVPQEEEDRQAAERQAAASTPEARAAQTRASNINAGVSPYDPTLSARSVFANPAAVGTLARQAQADQASAIDARKQRDGGFSGDLARLGAYAISGGPAWEATRDYLPRDIGNVLLNPSNLSDEIADQVIPGGSGTRGGSLLPFLDNTKAFSRVSGEDKFYPSETIQSGSYADGYRGVTNSGNTGVVSGLIDGEQGYPFADLFGGALGGALGGAGGAGGEAGTSGGAGGASGGQREYRTDALDAEIRGMLDAERRGGPSEAEALLKQATDRVAARSLGIAAGARGGAGARERARNQAISGNVSLGAQAAADLGALRAREANESKARQAQIMQLLQGNAAAGDIRDLGYEQTASGERQARYNVDATNARFNASQPTGLLDDPLAWLFERALGTPLRGKTV